MTLSEVLDNEALAERAHDFGAKLRAERISDTELLRRLLPS